MQLRLQQFGALALATILVMVTLGVRLANTDDYPITQDESTMSLFARNVVSEGYPFIQQKSERFLISTYELVPFPIAASIAMFGDSIETARIPATVFSAITVLVLFFWVYRLFGLAPAVVAATVYAALPWAVYWGSNSFYPAQLQLLSLIVIIYTHKISFATNVNSSHYYILAVFFLLMYLTWEGSGLLLPVIGIAIFASRWGNFEWINDRHGWMAGCLIIVGVTAQLTYRTLLRESFLTIGSSRANVSLSTLLEPNLDYDPTYYITSLIVEPHIVIFIFFLLGCWIYRSNTTVRFLLFVSLAVMVLLASVLGYYAIRYYYFMAPMILILASLGVTAFITYLARIPVRRTARTAISMVAYGSLLATFLLMIVPWSATDNRIFQGAARLPHELTADTAGFGFKEINLALQDMRKPRDIIIVQAPFPFRYHTSLDGDYFLQTRLMTSVRYSDDSFPYYADKWVSNPVLGSMQELEQILLNNARVWLLSVPMGSVRLAIDRGAYDKLLERFTVVKEVSDGQLLLWENPLFYLEPA